MAQPNVVLIGPMASGKSSVGAALARRLSRPHVDSDQFFVARHGSVAAFFTAHGEEAFRRAEETIVAELLASPRPSVISLGGDRFFPRRRGTAAPPLRRHARCDGGAGSGTHRRCGHASPSEGKPGCGLEGHLPGEGAPLPPVRRPRHRCVAPQRRGPGRYHRERTSVSRGAEILSMSSTTDHTAEDPALGRAPGRPATAAPQSPQRYVWGGCRHRRAGARLRRGDRQRPARGCRT